MGSTKLMVARAQQALRLPAKTKKKPPGGGGGGEGGGGGGGGGSIKTFIKTGKSAEGLKRARRKGPKTALSIGRLYGRRRRGGSNCIKMPNTTKEGH